MRDAFDMTGLISLLRDVKTRAVHVRNVRSEHPSPFAGAVLFNFVGNFIYDGDAPLAERRAQTLSLDHTQLRELLGTVDLREFFDEEIIEEVERDVQAPQRLVVKNTPMMFMNFCCSWAHFPKAKFLFAEVKHPRTTCAIGFETCRIHAACFLTASRKRTTKSVGLQQQKTPGDCATLWASCRRRDSPKRSLSLSKTRWWIWYLNTRELMVRSLLLDVAERLGLGVAPVLSALQILAERDRVIEGEFRPGRVGQEWCDVNVLKMIKRRSLAALRKEVEPVEPDALARFLPEWHSITSRRRGLDGLLDAIEQLQGAPLPASTLENEILPARVERFRSTDLDELCVQGEVIWRGFDSVGSTDGRIGLFLTDHYSLLAPPVEAIEDERAEQIRDSLRNSGGLFFDQISAGVRDFPE